MRGYQAFERTAAILLRRHAAPGQHRLERFEQLFGDHQILRIASMMKSHENLIGKPAAMARARAGRAIAAFGCTQVFISKLAHRRPAVRPLGKLCPTR